MLRGPILFATGFAAMLSAGWLVFPRAIHERSSQPIQFSHRTHTDKAGMRCDDCHSLRADGAFTGIPRIDKCAGCHAAPVGATADEKLLVDRYVTPNRQIPWKVYARQPDNAWFPHATHVNLAKLSCEQCHGGHGKSGQLRDYEANRLSGYSGDFWHVSLNRTSGKTGIQMSDCEHCHGEKGVVTSCIDCHK